MIYAEITDNECYYFYGYKDDVVLIEDQWDYYLANLRDYDGHLPDRYFWTFIASKGFIPVSETFFYKND